MYFKLGQVLQIKAIITNWGITGAFIVNFDWYLFQLIVLLKPDFNSCNSFALSWVDEVAIGT